MIRRNSPILALVVAVMASGADKSLARTALEDSTDVEISSSFEVENSVAVSPLDPDVILVGNNTDVYGTAAVDFWISTDGGRTWSSNFESPPLSVDPAAAISGNVPPHGRLLAGFLQVNQKDVRLRYKNSPPIVWSDDVVVSATTGADKPHLWVDNSPHSPPAVHRYHVYSAWTQTVEDPEGNPTNVIRVRRSTEDGFSWSPPQDLDMHHSSGVHGAIIQTGRTGRMYVAFQRGGQTGLGFAESNEDVPGAFVMKQPVALPASNPPPGFPSMAVDRSDTTRDHLYVVWASGPLGSPIRIMKGSAEFSAGPPTPSVIWDTEHIGTVNATTGSGHLPWITWDECTGMLAVTWLDLRNSEGRETYVAVAETRDADGGVLNADNLVWTELKVSDAHWITSTIPTPGYDYIGIAAGDGRIFPVWSDDRTQDSAFRPYTSPILLWGVTQDSVAATAVNNADGTMAVTATWTTNLAASEDDRITLASPNGVEYTSSACNTCASADGKTHTVVFPGVPCEPGTWTYTVASQRSGCIMRRTSDVKTFFVPPTLSMVGRWPATGGNIAKCPAGDPTSYDYTVDLQFQDSCLSYVTAARMTLEPLTMNPSVRKLAFFPQDLPQAAEGDATPEGEYLATILEKQVGGCGSDSAQIYLDGIAVGKVYVPFVPNVDLNGTGYVNASDLSIFAASIGTCSGHPDYNPCANFAGYTECIDPSDLSVLAAHFGHNWANPVFKSGDGAAAVTQLRIEPGSPTGSMNVAVRLEGLAGRSAFGVVLRPSLGSLELEHWIPQQQYESSTAAVDTVDALGRRVAVVALDLEPDASGAIELGNLIFTMSSESVTLSDLPVFYEDVMMFGETLASVRVREQGMNAYQHPTVLHQNQPNPFNPRTAIRYSMGREAEAQLEIFDVAGRRIRTVVAGRQSLGEHVVVWDGRDDAGHEVGTGIYVYRLATPDFVQTRKLVLVR